MQLVKLNQDCTRVQIIQQSSQCCSAHGQTACPCYSKSRLFQWEGEKEGARGQGRKQVEQEAVLQHQERCLVLSPYCTDDLCVVLKCSLKQCEDSRLIFTFTEAFHLEPVIKMCFFSVTSGNNQQTHSPQSTLQCR